MRAISSLAICASLLAGGCAQLLQGENSFRSPAVVGYLDGSQAARSNALSQVYGVPPATAEATVIRPGQCLAIFVHDGRIASDSENGADRLVARAMRRGVVAEWQITTTVTEHRGPDGGGTVETTVMPSTMVFQKEGDHKTTRPERIPYRNMPIYGPRPYQGGPVTIKVALSELDEKEADFNKMLVADSYDKAKTVLPDTNIADVAKKALVNGTAAFLKIGAAGYVALGAEALKVGWDIYNSVHKPDDLWLDETEGWIPAHYLSANPAVADRIAAGTGGRVLKSGIWTLARVSQMTSDVAIKSMEYDPNGPSELLLRTAGRGADRPSFLALRFASFAPSADGKCTR